MYTVILKQNGYYNVIRSTKPETRIDNIRRSTPMQVEVIRVIEGDNRDKILRALGNPSTQWFTIEPNKISKVLERYKPVEQADYITESETTFTASLDYYSRLKLQDLQEMLGTRQTVFQLAIEALYQKMFPEDNDDAL